MKIRYGLVSNSSSASFVIIGNSTNIQDLTEQDISNGIIVVGKPIGNAIDVINVSSKEILNFIVENGSKFRWVFKNAKGISDSGKLIIEQWMVDKNVMIVKASKISSSTIELLSERYSENSPEIIPK